MLRSVVILLLCLVLASCGGSTATHTATPTRTAAEWFNPTVVAARQTATAAVPTRTPFVAPANTFPTAIPAESAAVVIAGAVSHDTPDRVRRELNIIIADWSDRATVEGLLLDLVTSFLATSGADVVIVFAWDDLALVSVAPFNVGRAQLSRDGRGWEGDGLYLSGQGVDDGSILLEIVTRRSGPHVQGVEARRVPRP